MSRSTRKSPFIGYTTARSDAPFKRHNSRSRRLLARQDVLAGRDPAVHTRSAERLGPKDGKQMFDERKHPEWMRK